MLRLEDRLRIALGAGMGCQLKPEEVGAVAGMLVMLRRMGEFNSRFRHEIQETIRRVEDCK